MIHHLILLAKVLSPKKMYEKQIQAALIQLKGNRLYRSIEKKRKEMAGSQIASDPHPEIRLLQIPGE